MAAVNRAQSSLPLLHEAFLAWAARQPDAPAVLGDDGALSYGELEQQSRQFGERLRAAGVQRGTEVLVCADASAEYLVAMLALMRIGAVFVPLDPTAPAARRQKLIQSLGLRFVVTGPGAELHEWPELVCLLVIRDVTQTAAGPVAAGAAIDAQSAPDDPCYIMHTSGSTGEPRGVRVMHANVAGLFANLEPQLSFSPEDRWLALHSVGFGFSLWELWGPLSTGGSLFIVPAAQRADPAAWYALAQRMGITVLSLTPSGFGQWLQADKLHETDSLRTIVFSGEALRDADLQTWFAHRVDRPTRLFNTYALTETAGRVAITECTAATPANCIGQVTTDAELFLLDPDTLQACAFDQPGELFVSGPTVAAGYTDAALTAEYFQRMTTPAGERRCYRTGDLVQRTADGTLYYLGRTDEQIKLRGHRIEPGEVEQALRGHAAVSDAAVILDQSGPSPQLHAFVVFAPSAIIFAEGEVEFWPSLGEYQIYDDLLYDFMAADKVRVDGYRRAFAELARDRVVLDMGTGKDALLARLCVAAGARKVYAVEVLPDAAAAARALVSELGLNERIEVIEADLNTLELPEAIDLCTQGIVGNIGSSDGIVPLWNRMRQHFAPHTQAVPQRCTTLLAPATLNRTTARPPRFGALAAEYTRRVFASTGEAFDVRLCLRNFSAAGLLAESAVFEDLDFGGSLSADYSGAARFVVHRAGLFEGYVLWTRLQTGPTTTVDFLAHQQAWLPVWFPLPDSGVMLNVGDVIEARWECRTPAGQIFPDYAVTTKFQPREGASREWHYRSCHFEAGQGATPLHRELLQSLEPAVAEQPVSARPAATPTQATAELQHWLVQQLPDYMQPARISWLTQLPRTASGKVDKVALRVHTAVPSQGGAMHDSEPGDTADRKDADPFITALAAIWCQVLGRTHVAATDDFFECGGDSILAVRLTTEVQRWLDATVFLAGLYDAPTLAAYGAWLRAEHAGAVMMRMGSPVAAPTHTQADTATLPASTAPLSWSQQSLWLLDRFYPQYPGANEQFLIRTRGVPWEQLAEAWCALLERHDSLRTRLQILADTGSAVQRVMPLQACEALLLSEPEQLDADPAQAVARLQARAARDMDQAFDLYADALLRPRLLQLPDELVLLVTAHHIIADGLCVPLLRDELYAACTGVAPVRPDWQYADYARWQRAQVQGAWLQTELAWWQQQLAGLDGTPLVPGTISRQSRAPRIPFVIDAVTAQALRQFARAQGTTTFTALLLFWRVWLSRCYGASDILLGSPVTLRRDARTAGMIGCLVNNVAFRNPLQPDQGFGAALDAEHRAVLAALDHATVPFEQVVSVLAPERVYGRHPLFQCLFQYEPRKSALEDGRGKRFAVDVLPVPRASYWDLELSVVDAGEGEPLQATLTVQPELFDVAALSSWPEGLTALLQAALDAPDRALQSLPLLSPQQLEQRHGPVAVTAAAQPQLSLTSRVAAQAQRTPQDAALISASGVLSYESLLQQVATCTQSLRDLGVTAGTLVGVDTRRSDETVVLLLAINALGAVWLPLDPDYPPLRLQQMLEEARPDLLVSDRLPLMAGAVSLPLLFTAATAVNGMTLPDAWHEQVCVLYTSGSTGKPKAARVAQTGAVLRCQWMAAEYGFGSGDIFAQRTSLNFIDCLWEVFGALMCGATVALPPAEADRDPRALVRWCADTGVTHLVLVPSLLQGMLDAWEQGANNVGALHTLVCSGESLPLQLVQRLQRVAPQCRLLNTYGTSEAWDISCARVDGIATAGGRVPVGKPLPYVVAAVLDQALQALPCGVSGDLWVGGAGLLATPDNPVIATRPGEAGQPLYRTGDRASLQADGTLELQGRADRQVKLRGVRIEPGEVEAAALMHPAVAQAAVRLQRAEGAEPGDAWLALYVVPRENTEFSAEGLRDTLRRQLPHAMLPADIVCLSAMPLTPSGKVDTAALPLPARIREHAYRAPRTAIETKLAAIWAAALDCERVGIDDDFFALRGNSLLAARLMARIGDAFALELPLQSLFETPTVAGLARSIETLQWTLQQGQIHGPGQDQGDASVSRAGREVLRL